MNKYFTLWYCNKRDSWMFLGDGYKKSYLFDSVAVALSCIKEVHDLFMTEYPNGYYKILDQDFKIVHSTKTEIKQLSMFGGDHG